MWSCGKCRTTLLIGSMLRLRLVTLRTRNQHRREFCARLEVVHLFLSVGCAGSRRVCHAATFDARLRMEGFLAMDLSDV